MLITFVVIIAPFLALVPPLQRNPFFIFYFALMAFAAYICEETDLIRVHTFSKYAFLLFVIFHLLCINFVTFIAYGIDKRAAINNNRRVPEAQLHTLEFLGGWIGAFAAQKIFRHKTKKKSYQIMFWLMLFLQGAAIYIILRYLGLLH